jgi:hypothetical protein
MSAVESATSRILPSVPRAFQSLRALRALNVASVGFSLAAVTAAVFAHTFSKVSMFGQFAVWVGMPTLVLGLIWAMVLRIRKTMGTTKIRWGWVASIPLAMLNGGVACGLMLAGEASSLGQHALERFGLGLLLGTTLGALLWIPGLIATLLLFGFPIAWSEKLAAKGLAGEERGEIAIGAVATLVALLAVLLILRGHEVTIGASDAVAEWIGYRLMWLFAIVGAATGSAAAILAHRREARRQHFVKEVAEGAVPGFRVDDVPEGKVLVRVTSIGQGYRVANFEEELVELDAAGEAKKAMRAL